MTASDLCSSSKPWDLQLATIQVIYEEFYLQVENYFRIHINSYLRLKIQNNF